MKPIFFLFSLFLLVAQPVSAEIQSISWSESIHNTQKPPSELVNVDNYIIVKSDRSVSLDLTENSPIKTIIFRPDNSPQDSHFEKKSFLFTFELSNNAKKIIGIPFGEHKI